MTAAPDALVGARTGGEIVWLNEEAERLFDWCRHDLVGRRLDVLIPGWAATGPAAAGGDDVWARRRDGSTFPAEIRAKEFQAAEGEFQAVAIREVTDRRTERRRPAGLESAPDAILGGVAHDFNNLLGVILNFTTLISRRVDDPTVTADLAEIRSAAERGAALTRQLVAFAGREIANPMPVEVKCGADGAGEPTGAPAPVAGGRECVLVVEDEPMLRAATARLLAGQGYEVLTAGDGLEALEILDRVVGAIDLVLTDVAMPRMRGDELARVLADRATPVRMILTTGYDAGDLPGTARLLGKPVPEGELLRVIREVLDG